MVTTRSQDHASQGSASTPPPVAISGGSRTRGEHGDGRPAFSPARGGKRRRLTPPEQVAVPDSQALDDVGTARKLALRPHGSLDSSVLVAGDVFGSRDGDLSRGREDLGEVDVVEETQLPSQDAAIEEGAVGEIALEEGTVEVERLGEESGDIGSETGEITLPESSQTLRYRENDQVVESTQDLDNIITSSDYDTQATAGGGEPPTPHPQILQELRDRTPDIAMVPRDETQKPSAKQSYVANAPSAEPSRHFRFASEEPIAPAPPPPPITATPTAFAPTAPASEPSDDDAEPEIITASAGQDQARATAADSARAAQRALKDEKSRRRARDAKLKAQAQRRPRPADRPAKPRRAQPDAAAEELARALLASGPLPAELPDEILRAHAAAAARPRAAPARPVAGAAPRKRKFGDVAEKPARDVVRGATRVRVLPREPMALPPRAASASGSLREQWLMGHRGDGRVAAQRRRPRHPLLVS